MTEKALKEIMDKDLKEIFNVKNIIDFQFDLMQKSYTKGLETGMLVSKPQWHDLRKDPNDLPKRGKEVRVAYHPFLPILQDEDEFEESNGLYKTEEPLWLIDEHVYPTDDVLAWCELPKFKE